MGDGRSAGKPGLVAAKPFVIGRKGGGLRWDVWNCAAKLLGRLGAAGEAGTPLGGCRPWDATPGVERGGMGDSIWAREGGHERADNRDWMNRCSNAIRASCKHGLAESQWEQA